MNYEGRVQAEHCTRVCGGYEVKSLSSSRIHISCRQLERYSRPKKPEEIVQSLDGLGIGFSHYKSKFKLNKEIKYFAIIGNDANLILETDSLKQSFEERFVVIDGGREVIDTRHKGVNGGNGLLSPLSISTLVNL